MNDYRPIKTETVLYDCPTEDDDDDDDVDWDSLEAQELMKEEKIMQQENKTFQPSSPWGSGSGGWSQGYSPWGQQQSHQPVPGFQTGLGLTSTTTGGRWNPWGTGGWQGGQWRPLSSTPATGFGPETLDRSKRVVILSDLTDILVASVEAQGRYGVPPMSMEDIHIRKEVVDRLRWYGPSVVAVLIKEGTHPGYLGKVLPYAVDYLAGALRIPIGRIATINRPGHGSVDQWTRPEPLAAQSVLDSLPGWKPADMVMVGLNSGGPGQSREDLDLAGAMGIDYVDVQALLVQYR